MDNSSGHRYDCARKIVRNFERDVRKYKKKKKENVEKVKKVELIF
jgi:cob(I)alamin adenosyltransferase